MNELVNPVSLSKAIRYQACSHTLLHEKAIQLPTYTLTRANADVNATAEALMLLHTPAEKTPTAHQVTSNHEYAYDSFLDTSWYSDHLVPSFETSPFTCQPHTLNSSPPKTRPDPPFSPPRRNGQNYQS